MEAEHCGHIFVPTDFSPRALAAFRRACELARAVQAKVSLLHVTRSAPKADSASPLGFDALGLLHTSPFFLGVPGFGRRERRLEREPFESLEALLRQWSQQAFTDDVFIETFVRTGTIGDEVLRFIREHRVTLTVLGVEACRRRLRWTRHRLAELITRRAHASVMLVPTGRIGHNV